MLCDLGHRVVGIDPSEAMLGRARAKGLPATFEVGAFDGLPVASDSVDLATCALALTHVPDLGPAIAEIARVVRPGGRVVLSDVHPIAVATGRTGAVPAQRRDTWGHDQSSALDRGLRPCVRRCGTRDRALRRAASR